MITSIYRDMFLIYRSHPYSFHNAREPFSMTGGRVSGAARGLKGTRMVRPLPDLPEL